MPPRAAADLGGGISGTADEGAFISDSPTQALTTTVAVEAFAGAGLVSFTVSGMSDTGTTVTEPRPETGVGSPDAGCGRLDGGDPPCA